MTKERLSYQLPSMVAVASCSGDYFAVYTGRNNESEQTHHNDHKLSNVTVEKIVCARHNGFIMVTVSQLELILGGKLLVIYTFDVSLKHG